ncbi:hypothetical protein BH09BAC1_BH09BAC1_15490 [soil metagenome]
MINKLAIFLTLAIVFNSCSTDFDVTGDYQETMVVYGLLDASQDTQYIRISRGFISEDRSALEIAQEPDSIYYLGEQLRVTIEQVSNGARFEFDQNTNLPKDSGIFAKAPHVVYSLANRLSENESYKLVVENIVTGKIVTANTPMVKSFRLRQPSDVLQLAFTTSLVATFPNGNPQTIDVTFEAPVNGKVYDVGVRFYYRQWEGAVVGPGDTMMVEYIFSRNLVSADASGGTPPPIVAKYTGQSLLSLMGSTLSKNPNITREPLATPLEYVYYAGAPDLYNLLRTSQGQAGITALEATPIYSNIEGGYGIFSSRFSKTRPQVGISGPTKDSLKCGQYTRDLNFRVDVATSCN